MKTLAVRAGLVAFVLGVAISEAPAFEHTRWGMTLSEVQKTYPGGVASQLQDGDVVYSIVRRLDDLGLDLGLDGLWYFVFQSPLALRTVQIAPMRPGSTANLKDATFAPLSSDQASEVFPRLRSALAQRFGQPILEDGIDAHGSASAWWEPAGDSIFLSMSSDAGIRLSFSKPDPTSPLRLASKPYGRAVAFLSRVETRMDSAPLGHGYQNANWGISADELLRLYPNAEHPRPNVYLAKVDVTGHAATVSFQIVPGFGLAKAVLFFDDVTAEETLQRFNELEPALVAKYGPPFFSTESWFEKPPPQITDQIRAIALSERNLTLFDSWSGKDTLISLQAQFSSPFPLSTVITYSSCAGNAFQNPALGGTPNTNGL